MPKLLVLFHGAEGAASVLAEAAAEGAASVRFTEIDIRAIGVHQPSAGKTHKTLDATQRVAEFDAVVLAVPAVGEIPTQLHALLDELELVRPLDAFANTVFAVVGGDNTTLAGRVERLGGIIAGEVRGVDDPEARARATGKRTAKILGWVRHALSHEHGHTHAHSH